MTTIGSLWQNYNDFMRRGHGAGGGDEKKAKHYNNVVRPPEDPTNSSFSLS